MTVYEVAKQSRNRRAKFWSDINHGKPVRFNVTPKLLADIFSRVDVDPQTQCWIWRGAKDSKGYAQKSINGTARRLSRLMVNTFIRPLRDGEQANHNDECRNPKCINPAHLSPLGIVQNTADGNRARRTKRLANMLWDILELVGDEHELADKARKYLARIPEGRNKKAGRVAPPLCAVLNRSICTARR